MLPNDLEGGENTPYAIWTSDDPNWRGSSGPASCDDDAQAVDSESACMEHVGFDYGGNAMGSDGLRCGYAEIVHMIVDDSDYEPPSWYAGSVMVDETLTSSAGCQDVCAETHGCDFWSYEWEESGGTSCTPCAAGTGPNDERSGCTACVGTTFSTVGVCQACDAPNIVDDAHQTCSACAPGEEPNVNRTSCVATAAVPMRGCVG